MGKTERLFYHALAALVFAAACAWCLAALYTQLDAAPPPGPVPEASAAPAQRRFRGLLIRQEQRLPAGALPGTEAGTRLNAASSGDFIEKGAAVLVTGTEGDHYIIRRKS